LPNLHCDTFGAGSGCTEERHYGGEHVIFLAMDARMSFPVSCPCLQKLEEDPDRIQLRFWNWFAYGSSCSGQVHVSAWDAEASAWSDWAVVDLSAMNTSSVWSPKAVDLTAYAGRRVRVAFYHLYDTMNGGTAYDGAGWYVDQVQVVRFTPSFVGDFEPGWGDWYADRGIWEVGTLSAEPGCYAGESCAGTVLDGKYPPYTDSRLISPTVTLPSVAAGETLQPRFWNWFSLGSATSGQVEVSRWDPASAGWAAWEAIDVPVSGSSPSWSLKAVDVSAHAGERVRFAFNHITASPNSGDSYVRLGWYIDGVTLVTF
jgi:hypothetical protein